MLCAYTLFAPLTPKRQPRHEKIVVRIPYEACFFFILFYIFWVYTVRLEHLKYWLGKISIFWSPCLDLLGENSISIKLIFREGRFDWTVWFLCRKSESLYQKAKNHGVESQLKMEVFRKTEGWITIYLITTRSLSPHIHWYNRPSHEKSFAPFQAWTDNESSSNFKL